MKGQYLTIEYIVFFLIGISLIISVYFIFSSIDKITEKNSVESQLKAVGETIRGTVINVLETSSSTDSEINYNLSIPLKLSRCIYSIQVSDNLNLNCTSDARMGSVLSLYNLNITAKNIIYSTNGYVKIRALNGTVELG